jgi:hypothetical protein
MSGISDAEFVAHGLEQYGRAFLTALSMLAEGRIQVEPRERSTDAACLAAGEQFVQPRAETFHAQVDGLVHRWPRPGLLSARTGLALLSSALVRFKPPRRGLTIRPRDI